MERPDLVYCFLIPHMFNQNGDAAQNGVHRLALRFLQSLAKEIALGRVFGFVLLSLMKPC